MQFSYVTDFTKNICHLVWLIENSDKRGYYNLDLGQVTETTDGSDGVYKRPEVKLAQVLPRKDVCTTENRAGDVAAEPTNSKTKFSSASRPFKA